MIQYGYRTPFLVKLIVFCVLLTLVVVLLPVILVLLIVAMFTGGFRVFSSACRSGAGPDSFDGGEVPPSRRADPDVIDAEVIAAETIDSHGDRTNAHHTEKHLPD